MKKNIGILIMSVFLIMYVIVGNIVVYGDNSNDYYENEVLDSYMFNRIGTEDGLSQVSVHTILQDSSGYLWFGTENGLNLYDGNSFEVYNYEMENLHSLSGRFISHVEEDSNGNIWVATTGGLSRISKDNNRIYRYDSSKVKVHSLSDSVCVYVFEDSKGRLWIGTGNGLNLYNEKTDDFQRYYIENEGATIEIDDKEWEEQIEKEERHITLEETYVNSIEEDGEGTIWVGTRNGLYYLCDIDNKLKRYDGIDKSANITSIEYTSDNELWVSIMNSGIVKIDFDSDTIVEFKHNPEEKFSLASNVIASIMEDREGNIWIATSNGLSKYVNDSKFISYKSDKYNPKSLIGNSLLSLEEDAQGLIWIGTTEGISKFDPNQAMQYYTSQPYKDNTLSGDMFSGIYEDEDGVIWIGTFNDGLNAINRETGEITNYYHDLNNENSISSNNVWEVTGDGEGNIWIATSDGLNKFNKETSTFTRYYKDKNNANSLVSNLVREIHVDHRGEVWIGTREGLSSFNEDDNTFTNHEDLLEEVGVGEGYIKTIYEDEFNNLWIGAGSGELIKLNSRRELEENGYRNHYNDNDINSIISDGEGNLWLGTNSGAVRFNVESGKSKVFTEHDGLSNSFIYGILIDFEGNLWMSSNEGISMYNKSNDEFTNYNISHGLQGNEFNIFSYEYGENGDMYFGGVNGINIFNPENMGKKEEYNPKVSIRSVDINGIKSYEESYLHLGYNENNILIEFFVPYFGNMENIQYSYKLEGIDGKWRFLDDKNYVNYAELPPGEYTLYIKARTGNSNWSEETSVSIKIDNPPWRSRFAYAGYTAIIITIIIMIWRYFRFLDNLVSLRTKELRMKMDENKKLYDKLISIERHKNNYFINLSHELRTPLNVILSTEQLISTINKNDGKIEKHKLDYYMGVLRRNSDRLLRLINNIIDTSKIESGTYRLEYKETDIVYLTEEVALSMKDFIESNGIQFAVDPEMEELTIECDSGDIERCLVNIIGNAVKFTEEGGEILIKVVDEGEYVAISVKDTGIGIDKSRIDEIFDRFSQVYERSIEAHGGSGLGLTLTRQLVQLHDGYITVDSEVGVGSTFTIRLPKVKPKNK